MTKRIGIPGWTSNGFFGVTDDYMDFAQNFGNPVVLSPGEHPTKEAGIDALILPGGSDVLTTNYRKAPGFYAGYANPYLEYFDSRFLPEVVGRIPILGICRGLQILNVFYEGTLSQHVYGHTSVEHTVVFSDKSAPNLKVVSNHHQAIGVLGKGFTVEAVSKNDKIIEAISNKSAKILAVQWHPERMFDTWTGEKFLNLL